MYVSGGSVASLLRKFGCFGENVIRIYVAQVEHACRSAKRIGSSADVCYRSLMRWRIYIKMACFIVAFAPAMYSWIVRGLSSWRTSDCSSTLAIYLVGSVAFPVLSAI